MKRVKSVKGVKRLLGGAGSGKHHNDSINEMKRVMTCILLIAITPFSGIASDSDPDETSDFLAYFGRDPNSIVQNVLPVLSATNSPVNISLADLTVSLSWVSSRLDDNAIRPADRIRIFARVNANAPLFLGEAYLFATETNRLADLAFPLFNHSMSIGTMEQIWSPIPNLSDFCLRGTPTNLPPTRVFLARRGAVCILKSSAVTNLVEIAEIVCDTLSPPAEVSP